jgi:hypothetical protein
MKEQRIVPIIVNNINDFTLIEPIGVELKWRTLIRWELLHLKENMSMVRNKQRFNP